MSLITVYPYVALGIVISVVLPILRKSIPTPSRDSRFAGKGFRERLWPIAKPYVMLGIFSLLAAIIIVASLGDTLTDWKLAVIAGFSWDSLIQKAGQGTDVE